MALLVTSENLVLCRCMGCWCHCKGYRGQAHVTWFRAIRCSAQQVIALQQVTVCFVPGCWLKLLCSWGGPEMLVQLSLDLLSHRYVISHSAHTVACSQVMALWKEFFLGLFISTCLPLFNTLKWMWQSSFGYTFDEILKWQPWIL